LSKSFGPSDFPVRHLSLRIPWHDTGWSGQICSAPKANCSCLALDRIRLSRCDEMEEAYAGKSWNDLEEKHWPACVAERSFFMAPWEVNRTIGHHYTKTSRLHQHILPTPFRHPAHSAAAVPFRWMLKNWAWQIAEELNLDCDQSSEPDLGFGTAWVQGYSNQKALLDAFFEFIRPETSLCFFYCKQTPLADDHRRVLLGVGRVTHIGEAVEFKYKEEGGLQNLIWERSVQHSIRCPDFSDGFIIPYHDVLKLAEQDPGIEPADYLAFAPEDRRLEFSYASEHVTNDGAIGALLSMAEGLTQISKVTNCQVDDQLKWIDTQLANLWKLRGPFPGLGSALCAFGVEKGNFLAYHLSQKLGENENPWPLVEQIFADPTPLPKDLAAQISKSLALKWQKLPVLRRQLLELLSRFELNVDQATCFYVQEEREQSGVICEDKDLLSNPYLLYELTRSSLDPVSLYTADRGVFPDRIVRETHPLPEPSCLDGSTDARRVRALTVEILEQAGISGDTLLPQSRVIQSIRSLPLSPDCPVDQDLMNVIEDTMEPSVSLVQMKDGKRAYKLRRLHQVGDIIRKAVLKRFNGKRHDLNEDWRKLLDQELKRKLTTTVGKENEQRARQEKVAALQELGDSRFSVLVGPAGTGKTTLLATFCKQRDIDAGGVLLLAPTGKARVKLQQATGLNAQTLAQFLLHHDRYDERTGVYRLSDREPVQVCKTVIVDESSMLTEEQLGALIDSVAGVDRLILVGDPRQLPPIGAGRPFVDIVNKLSRENMETIFPKVGPSYAELTVPVRYEIAKKAGYTRCDLQLADWFSGRPRTPGDDEMFDLMATDRRMLEISFVPWTDAADLRSKIIDVLIKELRISGPDAETGFATKIGGHIYKDHVYFNPGSAGACEAWQIMSPVRGHGHGIIDINRWIQKQFRSGMFDFAHTSKKQIPRPMGPEGIIYGDKVINVVNNKRDKVYPKQDALGYVANGEIGVVIGKFRKFSEEWNGPLPLEVEFSSQRNFVYSYDRRDFKDEATPLLELAYAITVHKAQGSEFGLCLLILPERCRLISRELLYTALTRQRDRIVILHQGKRSDIIKYSSAFYSETARRLTNLFQDPQIVPIEDRFFEDGLIHRTARGEAVRSKSEVVIANSLFAKKIKYLYEERLNGYGGSCRFPDFTIKDDEGGRVYYWEHLGMLSDPAYEKRWKQKLAWYKKQNILEFEKGGGSNGTLIISRDNAQGGIDSMDIEAKIDKIFGS
jgi:hypothetical protein